MRVRCYLNIHKTRAEGRPVYSLQDAKTRRVIAHSPEVNLVNVEFRVSEAGRQRVLREKRKNVHAVCVGDWVDHRVAVTSQAGYNPYKGPYFTDRDTGEALHTASAALLSAHGLHYCK
jgi:hypothetical protein